MRKLFVSLFIIGCFHSGLFAGDGNYPVSSIDPKLLKGADAVLRLEEIKYEVVSAKSVMYTNHYVITVLNENGDPFASMTEWYTKLRSIHSIEGKLYDAAGKEIKKLKSKDIEDRSGVDESLIDDIRLKHHNFYYKVYPYTVEYEIVTEFNNTLYFPHWVPQMADHYAIEKSSMTVECPSWFTFHYKMFNYKQSPLQEEVKGGKRYVWQVTGLPAIINEPYSPDWQYLTTCVYFSPDNFEFEGYKGSMRTWKDIGDFQLQLNQGRDKLPDAVRQKVHELTDHITDVKEKIRIVYEYMQKNTRYISIQLGIGGLQPFDASYVATKAYGDCKALSNYMYSLLKEINIRSCYTQIKAGQGEYFFMPDFASDQFNHIILCVPLQKDSMWLECTSQTLAAGYLGDFTCDRYALLIDENGGHLVHTPKYGIVQNLEVRRIKATVDENGTLNMNVNTRYDALQQDDIHMMINALSKDKVKEYLHKKFEFGTYDIARFDYKENRNSLPTLDESLDITVSNYATITGKRLFIVPNIMTRSSRKLSVDTARKYDIVLDLEYQDIDTVEIEIPKGYEPESIPKEQSINSKFGEYRSSVKLSGNKLMYYRSMKQFSGQFPAADYADLAKFFETIYKADRNKAVLVKNEVLKAF